MGLKKKRHISIAGSRKRGGGGLKHSSRSEFEKQNIVAAANFCIKFL
jgi:hypothetical protein